MPPKKGAKKDNTALLALKRDLNEGTIGNLYVFHGEEAFLRTDYFRRLKQALLPAGLEDFNLHTAQGKGCSVEWIAQAVDCLPMMSQRTLVAVTDFDLAGLGENQRAHLADVLSNLPDYCCLVFVYDLLAYKLDGRSKLAALLKSKGSIVEFQRQSHKDLAIWVDRQFKAEGKSISREDAQYLIFLCGDLMSGLSSEIGKIAAYAVQPRIARTDIDAVAMPLIDVKVYQMTDAIAKKNFDKAASVLVELLQDQQSPGYILAVMGKYFRQLYTARLLRERGLGQRELMDLWEMRYDFQAANLMNAAAGFSLVWCRHAVRRCAEAELALRGSYGRESELLTGLLMELAAGRRVAV